MTRMWTTLDAKKKNRHLNRYYSFKGKVLWPACVPFRK